MEKFNKIIIKADKEAILQDPEKWLKNLRTHFANVIIGLDRNEIEITISVLNEAQKAIIDGIANRDFIKVQYS